MKGTGSRRRKLSWQVKLPLLLVVFATAPLALMAFWMFDLFERTYERSTVESLEALAGAKAEALEQFTEDRKTEVERMTQLIAGHVARLQAQRARAAQPGGDQEAADLPELRDAEALPTPLERQKLDEQQKQGAGQGQDLGQRSEREATEDEVPARNDGRSLRQELGLILWDQKKFEELLIIGADGRVLVSTFSDHEDRTAADLAYFQQGLGATYVQPVFMSPITERLTMVIASPIRDDDAHVVGVLAARLNLQGFFRLINDTTGLGETGETIVGKLIDSSVVFMAPTRHDPSAALERVVSLGSEQGQALQRAARGETGSGRAVDYRDACTYAAWQHVALLEWGIAVKIDCEEATSAIEAARLRMMVLALAIVALALVAAFFAARTLVRPLGELKQAADRISRGDLDVRVQIESSDEIGELADSFDRMLAAIRFFREHSRSEQEDAEELDALGDERSSSPRGEDEPPR